MKSEITIALGTRKCAVCKGKIQKGTAHIQISTFNRFMVTTNICPECCPLKRLNLNQPIEKGENNERRQK